MTGTIQPTLAFARGSVLDRPAHRSRSPLSTANAAPRAPKWKMLAAAAIALGLAATVYVMTPDEGGSGDFRPVTEPAAVPAAEPAIEAADLPLGSMYHVVDQVGARALWDQGITGAGVNVAVIDTGVAAVDGLTDDGKIVAAIDLSSEGVDPAAAYRDTNGHGTHMAGIIAGRESGADPALAAEHPEWFLGVAPDAGIVSVKVGNRNGDVVPGGLVAAVDWVVDNADEHDIRVINLSVGSATPLPADQDPLVAAVQRAWDAGIVVVTAAGNLGADSNGLLSPAVDPSVIAVGGADVEDTGIRAASWTSAGDGIRNPDFAAPGAHLQSLRAPGSDADVNHPEGFVDDETFQGSGSSQSAAVAAGVIALLLQERPELTNDQVKALLVDTASPMVGAENVAGAGLVDAFAANVAPAPTVVEDWPRNAAASSTAPLPAVEVPVVTELWSGATWWGATWWGATWWGATWWGATWWGATWWGATWWGATWWGATWWGATWWGATWWGATWWGATWWGATWWGATWWGATWWGATWWGATWWGATWWGATWWGATWWGATWWGATWW